MKLIRSILACCMALLILSVSTGFSISQHFCQGELLSSSVFGHAESCEMEMSMEDMPPCHKDDTEKSQTSFSEKPCCENQQAAVEGQDMPTLLKKGDNLIPSIKFLAAFTYVFVYNPFYSTHKDVHFADYSPPLIQRDIPVIFQSFLI